MSEQQCGYDLDLTKMDDGVLLVMPVECEYDEASNELIVRHRDWMNKVAARIAKRRGLRLHDIDDVQQEVYFSVKKAIKRYDTNQIVLLNTESFRRFVSHVIADTIKDFVKHERRINRRVAVAVHLGPGLSSRYEDRQTSSNVEPAAAFSLGSPDLLLERQEMCARLHRAIAKLSDDSRAVVRLLLDGYKLGKIAEKLGIAYESAKWQRRKALHELKTAYATTA